MSSLGSASERLDAEPSRLAANYGRQLRPRLRPRTTEPAGHGGCCRQCVTEWEGFRPLRMLVSHSSCTSLGAAGSPFRLLGWWAEALESKGPPRGNGSERASPEPRSPWLGCSVCIADRNDDAPSAAVARRDGINHQEVIWPGLRADQRFRDGFLRFSWMASGLFHGCVQAWFRENVGVHVSTWSCACFPLQMASGLRLLGRCPLSPPCS